MQVFVLFIRRIHDDPVDRRAVDAQPADRVRVLGEERRKGLVGLGVLVRAQVGDRFAHTLVAAVLQPVMGQNARAHENRDAAEDQDGQQ